jgi:hypothetical protein
MDNTIVINGIKRKIGTLLLTAGIKQLRDAISDFTTTEGDYARFRKPLLGLPVSELDSKYYFTDLSNWQKIIDTINPITKEFPWLAEVFDCDDRATLVVALIDACFEINTCRQVYCNVYRVGDGQFAYAHYANVFVTEEGTAWLWDADSGGQYTKITAQNPVIGNKRYELIAVK